MESLGFKGDYKIQTIYLEFTINQSEKMQFFDVIPFTSNSYNLVSLWGMDLNIETVEEIIAKKIHYRCEKGNARDIFDIALAIHKQPDIFLNLGRLKLERLRLLFQTVKTIKNDKKLSEEYLHEIEEMNPNVEYKILSTNAIYYLYDFLENYLGAQDLGIELAKEDLIEIENYVFKIL
jgi:predicted nucleotidyltransferase component of viral defense system